MFKNKDILSVAGIMISSLIVPVFLLNSVFAQSPVTPPITPPITPPQTPTPTPTPVCVRGYHSIYTSPIYVSSYAGETRVFQVKITNEDSLTCLPAQFNLTVNAGSLTASPSNINVTLSPKQTTYIDVRVATNTNTSPAIYPIEFKVTGPIGVRNNINQYEVLEKVVNIAPVISTFSLPKAKAKTFYKATISTYDLNKTDVLLVNTNGLPNNISNVKCTTTVSTDRKTVSCTYSGVPQKAGNYTVTTTVNDQKGGFTTKKYTLSVEP